MPRISEVFAIVGEESPGEEGIWAFYGGREMGWMPMVAADGARLRSFIPLAEAIKQRTGTNYRVIRLSTREDVTAQWQPASSSESATSQN